MSNRDNFVTRWLTTAPDWLFAAYTIAASFSTYSCMYAFRKPFAAATYDQLGTFVGLDLKTALVISQIIGYTLSKVIGMKVCSELGRANRALVLMLLIIWAQSALVAFAVVPSSWKVLAIFLNGFRVSLTMPLALDIFSEKDKPWAGSIKPCSSTLTAKHSSLRAGCSTRRSSVTN